MNIRNAMSRVMHPGDDAPAPDALTLLKTDHAEVETLFGKALGDDTKPSEMRQLATTICTMLTVHAEMEETYFYPELRRKGGEEENDSVLEANEEHGMAKDMIAKIQSLRAGDETLEAKLTVLKEMIMHHVREEESTIFKEARATLGGERLQELGEQMQAFKERAMARGGRGSRGGAKKSAARETSSRKKSSRASTSRKSSASRTTARGNSSAGGRKKAGAKKSSAKKSAAKKSGGRGR